MFRILIAFIFILNLSGCGYNGIQTYDKQVSASWSEILNQYQHRTDLIPDLVVSIKGYFSHEQEIPETVTLARSQANRVSSDLQKTPGDEQKSQAWQQAQARMAHALGQLTIISGRYPQLKAQEPYQNSMVQLEGSENRIVVARGRHIKTIEQYSVTIRKSLTVLTTKITDYTPKKNYLPDDAIAASKVPIIDFSQNANVH